MDDEHLKDAKFVTSLGEMMRKEPSRSQVRDRLNQDDTATLLYSSGTTGASKGVVSSHKNLIAMVQTVLSRFGLEDGEQRFICTVPMFHIYGLAAFATGLLASGSTIVVLSKFEIHDMLSAIEKYRATYLPLVPPILVALVNNADQINAKYDLSSLHSVLSGGAPLSKEVIEGFSDKYRTVRILQGYGLTESTGVGASTDSLEESRNYGTAGLLSPSMEAKIVDPDSGKALEVNRTGELWLRGPTIMKGMLSALTAFIFLLFVVWLVIPCLFLLWKRNEIPVSTKHHFILFYLVIAQNIILVGTVVEIYYSDFTINMLHA